MNRLRTARPPAIDYPTRDGRPMGETDQHRDEMQKYAIEVLEDRYEDDPRIYVTGNNFVYYTEGVLEDVVSPDCYVVKGVAKHARDIYKVWEEGGRVPGFALEVTSRKTRREDLGDKMTKYRDELGVREYFLFDPRGEWIPEKLRGFALREGLYDPVLPTAKGRLPSRELGLELGVDREGHLRFYPRGSDEPLPTQKERAGQERERARQEHERARQEHERAETAEAENRRLQAELERLRRGRSGGRPKKRKK
ncbi:MAG: Uma2 family endonuclease [Planctomycetes bacterium]|nr:Uma2 family endonuclease [Planctomycetota bacterium]